MEHISRRQMIKGAAAGAVASVPFFQSGCEAEGLTGAKPMPTFKNKDFYKADGSFDAEAAKNAYYAMMRAFNYPISDVLKTEEFWVCDFLQRDYEKLGMAGIFWVNEKGVYGETGAKAYAGDFKGKTFGYLGHEIYLLPGQVLPEHNHIGGPDGYGPKMEAWHIRYGSVTFFGEYKGAGDEIEIAQMPAAERPWGFGEAWFKSKYAAPRTAGQMYKLVDPESWHFQRAGAQGAIVSEYATYHNHVQFSKPGMEFDSSKAKTA
ncbi:MAG TPA: hypothetical protein VM695_01205 [Phycisphaerae bacterium]|nr:hypothetical protein [Phycisphaerae bacterium]